VIKVCYIITSLGKGGAERQLYELIKGINRNKFSPLVISLSESGYWKEKIQALGIQTIELRRKKNKEFSRLFRLIKLLRTIKADIVHTYMFSANTYGRIAAVFSGIPIIIASERNISEIGKDKKRYEIIIDQFLSIFTHQIICNSFNCYNSIVNNYSINKRKVITIHNGIDVSRYSKKDLTAYKNNSATKVIGTVGSLEHQKNHRHFLRMAKILIKKSENIYLEFLIVGKGQLMNELKKYSRTLGIEKNIIFTGEKHDLKNLYKSMDIFVLTSYFEGLPNVIMEAMASGLPVVAVDVGGIRELVIKDVTGFLCSADQTLKLAEKVYYLIKNEKKAFQMGENGRKHVATNFEINKMVNLTEETYFKLIKTQ
jgi:glycosyltransferase involved in cell wall biosynthesis